MKKLTFVSTFLIICLSSCDKDRRATCEGEKMIAYEFDMPVTVSPNTDTIQLGDTLWVELRIGYPTLNKLNGKKYDITKANLFMFFAVQDLLTPTVVPTGNYIPLDEHGNYLTNTNPDGDNATKVTFKVDGDECYWKRGFIITKKGLYMLGFKDDIDRNAQPHITECPYEEVTFKYNFNGGTTAEDYNYYFLQYSPDENARSWSKESFYQYGNYAFCVD